MTDSTHKAEITSVPEIAEEINLLEYIYIIVKYKKMILLTCVVTFVIACGLTLLMPNIYTSTARILPPQENSSSLSSMLGNMGDLASLTGISVGGGSGDLYAGMLGSQTISDVVIDKFHLMEVYDQETRVETQEKLNHLVNISIGEDDGIISVKVEDEDPVRAANIVNTYVSELIKLNVKLNLSNASKERLFLENRLASVTGDLVDAEEGLKTFQKKNRAISIDDQASVVIEAAATLRGELASKEIELGVLLSVQTEHNPQVMALREGIAQLKNQILRLERSPEGEKVSEDIFLTTAAMPELGTQYVRLLRDFKVKEAIYELLIKQYEMAKITAAKNTSNIQVLDHGGVADKKSKPSRALIVLIATFVAGFMSVLYAFLREYGQQMGESDRQLWNKIKKESAFKK